MRVAQKFKALTTSLPSPVGGWNARDSLAAMQPVDAVILENWFPSTSELILRFGFTQHATGIPGQVETVMTYNGPTSSKLFGIGGEEVYDATVAGPVGAPVVSGLTNSRWEYVNVATPGGHFLLMVNGADPVYQFDGTSWTNPAITGVSPSSLININLHKGRVWFIEKDSLSAWYLGIGAIAGAASEFDLSSVAQMGGYLVAMATWTIDAGYGVDDLAVFMTSEGEVLVYRGTNPASATDWALVGIFRVGNPIGRRCWMKFAGDLLIITQDGVLPMSGALQSSRTNPTVAITDKIQRAVSESVVDHGAKFGWQLLHFPKQNMLWVNVPINEGENQEQYVMNTISKSWCRFTGWNANCWTILEENPYFGGDGFIGHAWNTNSDNGDQINGDALPAFNYFGMTGQTKRWTMVRPVFRSTGTPQLYVNMNVEFDESANTAPLSFSPTIYGRWDEAIWDISLWSGGLGVIKNWQGVNGTGYCAAPRMVVAASDIEVMWVSTDFVYEAGGVL